MRESNTQAVAERVRHCFEQIHQQQMQGIPILNPMIQVETLGFQHYQGRLVGVVITPWLMSLMLLPAEGELWEEMALGEKQSHTFPSGSYPFLLNEIDGVGRYQSHSLFSPMSEFINHDHALAAAQSFLDTLMVEREQHPEEQLDQQLMERILAGEGLSEAERAELAMLEEEPQAPESDPAPSQAVKLSRRALLRGSFASGA
jgi:[NiFe] hydrogenase assembly HybE family chaperone